MGLTIVMFFSGFAMTVIGATWLAGPTALLASGAVLALLAVLFDWERLL
jgi:hypothetical protein